MLDWIAGECRGQVNNSNALLCSSNHFHFVAGTLYCGKRSQPSGSFDERVTWSVKVTSTLMAGPKVQQNIAQSITLPPSHSASWCHVFLKKAMDMHPVTYKENVTHQARTLSSIVPWSSSDALVPIVGAFGGWRGQHGQSEIVLSEPALSSFSDLSYSSPSVGLDHTGQASLPTCINEPWSPLSLVHHCSFLGPLLIDTDHWRPETPHKSCFGDTLATIWPFKSVRLPIFPNSNTSTLPTKYSPGPWYISYSPSGAMMNHCYSHNLSLVIMLCLIGVLEGRNQCCNEIRHKMMRERRKC